MPAFEIEPELAADAAVRPVAGQQIIAGQPVAAVRRLDLGIGACFILPNRMDAVLETQVDQTGKIGAAFDQILLDVILLQVDEGRKAMPVLRQEIEIIDLLITTIDASELPCDALGKHPLTNPEPVKNLKAALGPANGAAAHRYDIVVVDNDAGHAVGGKVDGGGKPDRAGTDDDHWRAGGSVTGKLRRGHIGKRLVLISCHVVPCGRSSDGLVSRSAARSTCPCRALRSRCAGCRCLSPRQRRVRH